MWDGLPGWCERGRRGVNVVEGRCECTFERIISHADTDQASCGATPSSQNGAAPCVAALCGAATQRSKTMARTMLASVRMTWLPTIDHGARSTRRHVAVWPTPRIRLSTTTQRTILASRANDTPKSSHESASMCGDVPLAVHASTTARITATPLRTVPSAPRRPIASAKASRRGRANRTGTQVCRSTNFAPN